MLRARSAVRYAVVGVIAAGLAAPLPATAGAGVPTCNGQEATIVGEPGAAEVHGTPGDDVIVTTDTDQVNGLAGDDTICLTGRVTRGGGVSAGPGNDYVDATAVVSRSFVASLDEGGDIFVGSPGRDEVYGATSASSTTPSRTTSTAGAATTSW